MHGLRIPAAGAADVRQIEIAPTGSRRPSIQVRKGKRNGMGKRVLSFAIVLALMLSLLMTGCGAEDLASLAGKSDGWVASDIIGTVEAEDEFRLQDDFAAAANKDWILAHSDGRGASTFADIIISVLKNKRALLEDPSVTGKGIEEVRKYAALLEDQETRDRLGMEPVRKYIEEIGTITDTESLYAYLCDPERNPLGAAPLIIGETGQSFADPSAYMTLLRHGAVSLEDDEYFDVGLNTIEKIEVINDVITYLLEKMGYESSDIERIIAENYSMEKAIVRNSNILSDSEVRNKNYTRSDLQEAAKNYPILTYLDTWGFQDNEQYMIDIGYVNQLDQICSEGNIPEMKSYLTVRYLFATAKLMDSETLDAISEMEESKSQEENPENQSLSDEEAEEYALFEQISMHTALMAAINEAYVNRYMNPANIERLETMTKNLIEAFREVIREEEWLSQAGKDAAIEKLDAMGIHIMFPNNEYLDFSGFNIVPADQGGNLVEAYFEARKASLAAKGKMAAMPFDRSVWDPYYDQTNTLQTNAFYSPMYNGIYICAGIVDQPSFYEGITDEELYGALGVIVGHEITHGFDDGGVRYNKDGSERAWMPDEDQMAFNDRADKVSAYYSNLDLFAGAGSYGYGAVNKEAIADMGGMRLALKVAEKMPGFNYDAFFRKWALIWATQTSVESETARITGDPHPLAYLRINVTCQQFEKFYETYDIKEGDLMYLAPDKRITVW